MSKYTIELGRLVEMHFPLALNRYPIFNEDYRDYLNQKIIDHFYFREIGQETPERFNFFLARKMNEIMPYYNQLYKSELLQFNPLATTQMKGYNEDQKNEESAHNSQSSAIGASNTDENFASNRDTKGNFNMEGAHTQDINGSYTKEGNETVDTTNNNLRTDNLKENIKENVKTNTKTTNDLHEVVDEGVTSSGTRKASGKKSSTFSDYPQAGIETTINADGSVTTKGYATTNTSDSYSDSEETTGKTDTDRTTDNTGTVTVEGTSERTQDKTNTGTVNTDDTGKKVTAWDENGTNKENTDYKETEENSTIGNEKEDSERKTKTANKNDSFNLATNKSSNMGFTKMEESGRAGFSPSQLLNQYRETFLNIDMQIIDELEILFMGVY